MEALGRWKNPLHDRQLYLSFLCLLLHVTVAEEKEIGGRRKWKGKEGKKTRDEINSILAWRVGARGWRGLLRGEASGQMELDCTLSVGGWSDSFEG